MNSDEVFMVLTNLADVGSTKTKQKMLKIYECPLLLKVLKYAYDPAMKFNIANPQFRYHRGGDKMFNDNTFIILDQLISRQLSGKKARIIVASLLAHFNHRARELFLRILKKDLRCGISIKTINKAYPNLIDHFEVMLAKEYDANHMHYPCYVQPKVDGVRGILKDGKFHSRFGNVFKGLEHLEFDYIAPLDGELWIPDMSFEKMSGLIRNHYRTPQVVYILFDYIEEGVSYINRLKMIEHVAVGQSGVYTIENNIAYTPMDVDFYYTSYLHQGYEGAMVKTVEHLYQYKRSWDWMKMKKRESVDVTVTEVQYGQGKYVHIMGYLICDYKGKEIRVGSGFSDAMREEFTLGDSIIGKTIEVFYQEETADGVLRHPVFKCIKGV